MQLEHEFTVPVEVGTAWAVLLDIEKIAPCMPGAALDTVDGDDFTGTVKVRLGPIGLTYKGKASFVEKDESTHRAVIDARGRDARGNGTANAKVTATLTADGTSTKVAVVTELDITGKPAQFGRGVMVDVGNKLIGQFADCLAQKLAAGEVVAEPADETPDPSQSRPGTDAGAEAAAAQDAGAAAADGKAEPAAPAAPAPPPRRPAAEAEPINLLESAGPAVAKRLAPLALAALVVVLAMRWRRSR